MGRSQRSKGAGRGPETTRQSRSRQHAAQNTKGRRSAVPDEVMASEGYALSLVARKRIEEIFGWTASYEAHP